MSEDADFSCVYKCQSGGSEIHRSQESVLIQIQPGKECFCSFRKVPLPGFASVGLL